VMEDRLLLDMANSIWPFSKISMACRKSFELVILIIINSRERKYR
jgi:hypothetical protein